MPDQKDGFFKLPQGYRGYRPDILKMIPHKPKRILDIGCGGGGIAIDVKERWPDCEIFGIEADPKLASVAAQHMKVVSVGSCTEKNTYNTFSGLQFDIIIMADIIEHLADPHQLFEQINRFQAEETCLITSIPNIRHYSTFVSLFILGTWPQRDRGIHDRTHLRFFTRKDMLKFYAEHDLEVEAEKRNVRVFESQSWSNIPSKILDFWPFRSFLTFQYLHRLKPKQTD